MPSCAIGLRAARLDLRTGDGEKGRELAAKLYDCIGRAMADLVTRGIPAAKRDNGPRGEQ